MKTDIRKSTFELIEFYAGVFCVCRHFITQTVFAPAKTFSLFLTLLRPAGYGGQEDKTSSYNTCEANASCTAHNSCFASAKTFSLFLKRREGAGREGTARKKRPARLSRFMYLTNQRLCYILWHQ